MIVRQGKEPPAPFDLEFKNGIKHPDLYLWDAWSYAEGEDIHLYCLAVPRIKEDGSIMDPSERNNFPFHIRHFSSNCEGKNWKDEGCFLSPNDWPENEKYYTVWSGSIEPLSGGNKLAAFTTLEKSSANHMFIQNIGLALSRNGVEIDTYVDMTLSSALRDWEQIRTSGYYLDISENIGSNDGEEGGPILAWRDPFIFVHDNDSVSLFWAGKISPTKSALVRTSLVKEEDGFRINKLYPPVTVPDSNEFTQLELPKVYFNKKADLYYLIISTCNRLYEGQSDKEVDKSVRIYSSSSINGPWKSLGNKILASENLFGLTVLKTDFENDRLLCIAPYTDAADIDKRLTFSNPFYIYLDPLKVVFI